MGNRADSTYTLDFKSGDTQMNVTRLLDGSFLTREGQERGWRASLTTEVSLAETILRSAVEIERAARPVEVEERDKVILLPSRSKPQTRAAAAAWFRSAATRAALAAAFAFAVIALF